MEKGVRTVRTCHQQWQSQISTSFLSVVGLVCLLASSPVSASLTEPVRQKRSESFVKNANAYQRSINHRRVNFLRPNANDKQQSYQSSSEDPYSMIKRPSLLPKDKASTRELKENKNDKNKNGKNCNGNQVQWIVSVFTDEWGLETSWDIRLRENPGVIIEGVKKNSYKSNKQYVERGCVDPTECYVFTIKDAEGDGMCCKYGGGNYAVSYDGNFVGRGGRFQDYESVTFGNCPKPTTSPTATPTLSPTVSPTILPSKSPTQFPSASPTKKTTSRPSTKPTENPTSWPTKLSNKSKKGWTESPTWSSSPSTTWSPSPSSTESTGSASTSSPATSRPKTSPQTIPPTPRPTATPSSWPTLTPSVSPTTNPSSSPTATPSSSHTTSMTGADQPTMMPAAIPSSIPSSEPSSGLSSESSSNASSSSIYSSTETQSMEPSLQPSTSPSLMPSTMPISIPTSMPTPISIVNVDFSLAMSRNFASNTTVVAAAKGRSIPSQWQEISAIIKATSEVLSTKTDFVIDEGIGINVQVGGTTKLKADKLRSSVSVSNIAGMDEDITSSLGEIGVRWYDTTVVYVVSSIPENPLGNGNRLLRRTLAGANVEKIKTIIDSAISDSIEDGSLVELLSLSEPRIQGVTHVGGQEEASLVMINEFESNNDRGATNLSSLRYSEPIDLSTFDGARFAGAVMFLFTLFICLFLTISATRRRRRRQMEAKWGNFLASEENVESFLRLGLVLQSTETTPDQQRSIDERCGTETENHAVYLVPIEYNQEDRGYNKDDSMLKGGYQNTQEMTDHVIVPQSVRSIT